MAKTPEATSAPEATAAATAANTNRDTGRSARGDGGARHPRAYCGASHRGAHSD